jgi:hexosaminidase
MHRALTVVPAPSSIVIGNEKLTIPACVHVDWTDETFGQAGAALLAALPGTVRSAVSPQIRVELALGNPGGYRLSVSELGVVISAPDARGAFHGVQVLRQLLPDQLLSAGVTARETQLEYVEIVDEPAYEWRGLMVDVSRHFLPIEFLYRIVDLLALHRMSMLHLHLTDDQGWRIEIDAYPELTRTGAWRSETAKTSEPFDVADKWAVLTNDGIPHGGFYTKQQLRELVVYASGRFVEIVPEIDMPGHMLAAIAAYPQLGNGLAEPVVATSWGISDHILNLDDATLQFCRTVLSEVAEIFPSSYVHTGGDEVPKGEWERSTSVRQRAKSLGLTNMEAMQGWFVGQMTQHLESLGRRVVGWDEILDSDYVPADAVVMGWRSPDHGKRAAEAGFDTVMAPKTDVYLDMFQAEDRSYEPMAFGGLIRLRTVYEFDPMPPGLSAAAADRILGASAALWTELIATPARAEYMLLPRLSAFSEAVWRPSTAPVDYGSFLSRMTEHLDRLEHLGYGFRRLGSEDRADETAQ